MLGEILIDQALTEHAAHSGSYAEDTVRRVVSPELQHIGSEELERILDDALTNLSPEEIESFWKTVKSIAPQVLPVAGTIVGGIAGGPAGAALGGSIGGVAGKLMTPAQPKPKVSQNLPAPQIAPKQAAVPPRSGSASGSSAASQLNSYLQNPQFLKAIAGLILGDAGNRSVSVGKQGAPAPTGAFLNTLIQLATKALGESDEQAWQSTNAVPEYLHDAEGHPLCEDPASPVERAEALLQNLSQMRRSNLHATAESERTITDDNVVLDWMAEAGLVEGYEETSAILQAADITFGETLGVPQPVPPYTHYMRNRVAQWSDSAEKRRLLCLLDGFINGTKSDLRYYNRNWVRRVANLGYAPGTALAALSDLNDTLKHYDKFRPNKESEDDFILNIDQLIVGGITELRKFLVIWPESRQVKEMAKFVTDSESNPKSLYSCYESLI